MAARVANAIVGNDDGAALIEMVQVGPDLRFEHDALVAWRGADFGARVGDEPLRADRAVHVRAGEIVRCGHARQGLRAWLAVAGGIDVPAVLGSRSTDTRAGIGGMHGRALRADDTLPVGPASAVARAALASSRRTSPWAVHLDALASPPSPGRVRFVRGPEWDWFADTAHRTFVETTWRVTNDADRMGVRLDGAALRGDAREMISDATPEGTVQVTAEGRPILLLAGRQTVGGYPRIAMIASVDFSVLAQWAPGDAIRFQEIPMAEAHAHVLAREHAFQQLRAGLSRLS
jgi:antagonist of KipI